MSPFLGTDVYAIDHKGRISIPASMRRGAPRRGLITRFVLNMGFDGCVHAYSPEEWERMMGRLRGISLGNPTGRAFRRAFMMDAREVTVDSQGRVPIPPALMRRAALGKEAVLHGAEDHIEIWNPERFRAVLAPVIDVEGQYEKLAAEHLKDEP
ncbi:MAG TPA: division/cell wall cluster transcriptional repressor MraZ [Candidatus Eisenbacteria bacterium]|jgi:MraZ protein